MLQVHNADLDSGSWLASPYLIGRYRDGAVDAGRKSSFRHSVVFMISGAAKRRVGGLYLEYRHGCASV